MKILILSAFEPEIAPLQRSFATTGASIGNIKYSFCEYREHKLNFALTSIGTVFAASVMSVLCQALQPDLVIFIGTAGGIDKCLKIGDIVIVDRAIDIDLHGVHDAIIDTPFAESIINPHHNESMPREYMTSQSLVNKQENFHGLAVTSNYFPAPSFVFEKIKSFNPMMIDMESSAIAQVGWLLNVNTIIVRCISNILNDNGKDDDIATAGVNLCGEKLARWVIGHLHTI